MGFRKRVLGAVALCAAIASTMAGVKATPLDGIGSPLVGSFCATGAAITGQGATFANNAYTTTFIPAYAAACSKGSVSYIANGSGAGQQAAINHTPDFAQSDDPLSLDQWLQAIGDAGASPAARVSPIHHIPLAVGAVTASYNLASCGIGQEKVNFRSQVLGAIYSGLITNWSDALLAADNPALATCNKAIKLVARADVSGTTFVFKDYLAKRNPQFQAFKQTQLNQQWPAESLGVAILRGNGNGGVASIVKSTDGAIGYVELSTARKNGLTWGLADGPHLQFITPDTGKAANCLGASQAAVVPLSTLLPTWDAVSITDTPDPTTYPVCSMTYALVFNNPKMAFGSNYSAAKAQTLVDFLAVALSDATQAKLELNGYQRLPINIQLEAQLGLASISL